MSRMSALLAVAALAAPLAAEDFGPVVKTVALIYQGKTHFGVACNFSNNRDRVADLQRALPEGSTLTVVDVKHPMQVGPAASAMRQRGVELVALMPRDTLIYDGSAHATALIGYLGDKVPAFGTTAAAIKNGCALALGQGTNWELMINPKFLDPNLKGVIGPVEGVPLLPISMGGSAALDFVAMTRR